MNGRKAKAARNEKINKLIQDNLNGQAMQAVLNDPQSFESIRCTCGCHVFDRATVIKILPATHPFNPTGQTRTVKLDTYVCRKCSALLDKRLEDKPAATIQ